MKQKNTYVSPCVKVVKFVIEVGAWLSGVQSTEAEAGTWNLSENSNGDNNSNTRFFERSWDY